MLRFIYLSLILGLCRALGTQQRLQYLQAPNRVDQQQNVLDGQLNKECSPGHYRDNQGLFLGRCVPCRCNGHSSRCHDGSGICINCQQNTAGDNCELCKEGYMGNATHGTCRLCPCPLSVPSNSFATGCIGSGRNMQCFCKPGYTGLSCENCAPGYFGNPLKFGSSCQPCNCGNNGHRGNCDSLTGECLDEDPKDTDGDESCDSCANILLLDLSTMKDEINLIKARLQNIGANSQALDQLKALEARIRETQAQYESYNNKIRSQKSKVEKLETDTNGLKKEIAALLEKAAFNSKKYEKLAMDAEDTFRNASHLLLTIDLLLKNINILVKDAASSQGSAPSGDSAKNLAEAQRMLNEMRKRNFNPQKREAESERNEAKALLDRVRNQFQKHQGQHKDLIKSITKSINDYEAKLNDLREALDEATAQTKQANNINKDNEALLEDLKKRIRDLTKQQKDATANLNAAETSLGQTSSMLRLLQKSKEDYEKLAAQLDGAKQELNEKVSLLSKAASKEPLVIMAEKHAQSLQDLTKQLEEMKKNTSSDELVKCAVDASNAYENIINAVKEADEASKKAKGAADSALKKVQTEDLPGKAKKSKDDSQALLDQAKKTQKSFEGIKPELEDLKDRLVEAKDKKKLLSGDLSGLQTSIDDIKRDDIENMINNAKAVVKNADGITKNVLEELKPIEVDVKNLNGTYGSTQSADFNKAIAEASKSVKNLTDSLPDLLDAMNRINNLMPLGNISENVSRIRELIQQARDAANKVAIPMRFNGTSGVEVQPPTNLEDLKAYTLLSFYLQRPESRSDRRKRQLSPNMFVMYLGSKDTTKDYMGFAIDDDRLLYVYNLGGNEAKLHVKKYVTASNPNEAIMDRVVLERIYQHATIQYIKSYTSSKPSAPENYNYNTKAERHTLFNLDPKDVVFYVGGYPKDFRPPTSLNYPNFKGCIEFDYLNQIGVSLYNFKRTFNLNTTEVEPCRRHKRDSGENYFEGFGYANLSYKLTTGKSLLYEQSIQTTVDSGLLLFAEDNDNYISLNIEGGILVLKYKINSDTVKEAKSNGGPINNGNDYLIGVRLSVKDRGIRITHTGGLISLNDVDFFSFSTYYMGGVPSEIREKFNIQTPAFRGCVKNVKTPVGTAKFQGSYGVSRKCFDGWKTVRDAEFSRGGTLGLKSDNFPFPGNFQASFGFQTLETNADMFTHVAQSDDLSISLEEGTVTVNTRNTELQSTEKYLDGKRHYVSVIRNDDRLSLLVDDEPVTEKNVGSVINIGRSTNDLYFGGKNFEGCISDVFIQRTGENPTVQNLHDNNEKKQVSLGTCMVEEPPVPLILNEFKVPYPLILNDKDMNYIDIMTNAYRKPAQINQQGCIAHSNLSTFGGAYQFGDIPDSILLFKMNNPLSQERSHFSLDVRTMEPAGLILMMRDQYESTHLTLHLSKGRFVLSLGIKGHKIKIRSQDKYNDGKWHTVVFSWDGFNGRLVIDGLKSRKGSLTRIISLESMSSVHLGGVPSLKLQGIPKKSFIGCVRNVQVDGTPLEKPSQVLGVLPCYDGNYETGVFFAEDGGHIIVDKNFVLMPEFEMALNVRPRSQTGVIMQSGTGQGDRLSLYMDAGKVTLSLSRGGEDFQVSVTPLALCDGQWHRITASLTKNALVLHVDNQSKQTTGPSLAMYKSTTAPFYIGGVPATSHTPGMPVKSSFVGCMKDVKMNKKLITFRKISELSGAISLSRCPAA